MGVAPWETGEPAATLGLDGRGDAWVRRARGQSLTQERVDLATQRRAPGMGPVAGDLVQNGIQSDGKPHLCTVVH